MSGILSRETFAKIMNPLANAVLRAGFTPDTVTIFGTAASVVAALTLFPTGHLFWGGMAVWLFTMFDMLDGAMARARGGGTRFGAVLDATCDRVADGAIFAGLLWWVAFGWGSTSLVVATLICMITSQVTSYVKARAEASGLRADGGLIERPERLIIVLAGAIFSGGFGVSWPLHAAMWVLAIASLVTVAQRMHAVRTSPGALDLLPNSDAGQDAAEKNQS
jgi:CDP-diacylglycerol---glycerol-3-phosphate 3-phosphatidyltransferase